MGGTDKSKATDMCALVCKLFQGLVRKEYADMHAEEDEAGAEEEEEAEEEDEESDPPPDGKAPLYSTIEPIQKVFN